MTKTDERDAAAGLVEFLRACPTAFHAVDQIRRRLDAAGFAYLSEGAAWDVRAGGSYYTVRNNSSVVAWKVGAEVDPTAAPYHFQMCAAHGDSPSYKVKAAPELAGPGEYLRLDVEGYGGMLDHTWLDRPLGVAGRALVRVGARVESRLVDGREDVCLIPSLAIHFDRERGLAPRLNRAVDLCPLFSAGALERGAFARVVAEAAGCAADDLLGYDLFLVAHEEPRVWGVAGEFVSGGHIDDLQCAYAALRAFLATDNARDVSVFACFDNEEVGSLTKQGASSTLLADALARVSAGLGATDEAHRRALAASMLLSCDNAHAVHPNHAAECDEANRCALNGGLVVKESANQLYCTDAFSRAALVAVLERAGVPYQVFANRSDKRGGSTLGNLSNAQVSVHAVDVGCPQLAMHSVFETAGARDTALAIDALSAFYGTDLVIDGADSVELR